MQQSDADITAVKAAINEIYAALSARDMSKMDPLWVHGADVVVVNVPNKVPSIGWDAAKKNWEAVFDHWSEVSARPNDPHIQFIQGAASTTTIVTVNGKTKDGQPASQSVMATQIFVKHGQRWLAVAHHASRIPD
jgi:ketosteroid isomerase-like protein